MGKTKDSQRVDINANKYATPVMAQYIEIKAANPDCLLFYRMGDFYELFFDDAEEASRALGIILTSRGKHLGEEIPMCGVPVSKAEEYLNRLIQLGHRVAIAEQLEDPSEAKKRGAKAIVKRDVVRLITPGTITEDALLDSGRPNHLLAISRACGFKSGTTVYGLAWIDLSTGVFRVAEIAAEQLLSEVARIGPVEVVLPKCLFNDGQHKQVLYKLGKPAIVAIPSGEFGDVESTRRLTTWYGNDVLNENCDLTFVERSAASGVLAYVERTQLNANVCLEPPKRDALAMVMKIDAPTRASLEIMRTQSGEYDRSLLSVIDRTVTPLGRRLLVDRVSSPSTDILMIQKRLHAVRWFYDNRRISSSLRSFLKSMPDMLRPLSRLAMDRANPRDLVAIRVGLDIAKKIADLWENVPCLPEKLEVARNALRCVPLSLRDQLVKALADKIPVHKRDGNFVAAGYDECLDKNRELSVNFRKHIAQLEIEYAQKTGIKALRIKHNNILGFFIDLSLQNGEKLLASDTVSMFIHRQTLASSMRFTTMELSDLDGRISAASEQAFTREMELFYELSDKILAEDVILRSIAMALATIDLSIAFAELARIEKWCQPEVENSLVFKVEGGRHPVVERELRNNDDLRFICNSCDLSPTNDDGYGRLVILTGPNMGGKSTWLRQNALIVLLAQIGSFVPAESATIGIVDRLFSRVGASDDLARGCSTFMLEMLETAEILKHATSSSLVILDEIGRGTATFDGLSIAWGVLEYLVAVNKCRAIFATHYHELTKLSEQLPSVENRTVKVKEWNGDIIFLREIVPGTADKSYGIQVAQLAGLPSAVIDRAQKVLGVLEGGKAPILSADVFAANTLK